MLAPEQLVKIFNEHNHEYVEGIITLITSTHIDEIEILWKPELVSSESWDKRLDIKQYLQYQHIYEVYVLESNSIAQGLIILRTIEAISRLEPIKNVLYIKVLVVAPWNRPSQSTRSYKGVGTVLLLFSILHSINLGFKGRIALHSMKEAEGFYQQLPFIQVGSDLFRFGAETLELKYLELPEDEVELIMLNSYLSGLLV